MRERPSGRDLLDIAAEAEAEDLSDAPDRARYRDLMVANARAIAARQAEAGDGPEGEELAELRRLLGKDGSLEDLHRQLAAGIRAGFYRPAALDHRAVHDFLKGITRRNVLESNPRYLENKEQQ